MTRCLRSFFLTILALAAFSAVAQADSRVFPLSSPQPEEIAQTLRNTYGDKVRIDIVQGRLLVVGTRNQLDEIGAALVKLDPAPVALRLSVREQPPADASRNTITYSTADSDGYTVDTVTGAVVALQYDQLTERPGMNGWWVTIEDVPTQFQSLTLQVRLLGGRNALVVVSYARQEDQQRRVFSNTVSGELGHWLALLPQPAADPPGTVSSGPKPGSQLYLRIDKKQ